MLGPVMRWLLLASGPMNLGGAVLFAPPMGALRQGLRLPDADALYLWILSAWVLAFGVAYFAMGWTGRPSRGVIALGAWGKAVFAVLVMALAARGRVSLLAGVSAMPDLLMSLAFAWWLWTSPSAGATVAATRGRQ
jgi:hypothetical protein